MQLCVLLVSSGADRISEAETKRGGDWGGEGVGKSEHWVEWKSRREKKDERARNSIRARNQVWQKTEKKVRTLVHCSALPDSLTGICTPALTHSFFTTMPVHCADSCCHSARKKKKKLQRAKNIWLEKKHMCTLFCVAAAVAWLHSASYPHAESVREWVSVTVAGIPFCCIVQCESKWNSSQGKQSPPEHLVVLHQGRIGNKTPSVIEMENNGKNLTAWQSASVGLLAAVLAVDCSTS